MSFDTRKPLYIEIEKIRGRPLIVYVTSSRPGAEGQMERSAIPEFLDQLGKIPAGCKGVDLLLVSNGGDPTVAWRIISLLRERFDFVGVLVPQAAFSAATLIALGADEIVMHPSGNLGPVDPQIQVQRQRPNSPEKETFQFGAEDLAGFLNFVRTSVGLSDQEYMKSAFELFCNEVGAVPIGVATRGSQLAVSMSEKLLKMHMKDTEGQKAKTIAETLNTKFFHHGYPVGRKEAKQIDLKVIEAGPAVEDLIWKVWKDLEDELKCRSPFNPMQEVMQVQAVADTLFAPIPVMNLPSNLPPPVAQQVLQQMLAQVHVQQVQCVDYEFTRAVLESERCVSTFVTTGKLMASRAADLKIVLNQTQISSQWRQLAGASSDAAAPDTTNGAHAAVEPLVASPSAPAPPTPAPFTSIPPAPASPRKRPRQ